LTPVVTPPPVSSILSGRRRARLRRLLAVPGQASLSGPQSGPRHGARAAGGGRASPAAGAHGAQVRGAGRRGRGAGPGEGVQGARASQGLGDCAGEEEEDE